MNNYRFYLYFKELKIHAGSAVYKFLQIRLIVNVSVIASIPRLRIKLFAISKQAAAYILSQLSKL